MITLHHRPKTRSTRFLFLLEELGAPYEVRRVTESDPSPHPHGKVPAIRDSDTGEVVYESPAIALYLTDKFTSARLGPTAGAVGRGAYLSWLVYYGSVLEPAFMCKFMNVQPPRQTAGWVPVEEVMEHVVATLSKGPYLLGESFSAADVLYGTTFAMFGRSPMMPKSDVVEAYAQRVMARPAYARGLARDEVG